MNKQPHVLFLSSWYPTLEKPFLGNFVQKHGELIAQNYVVTVLDIQASSSTRSTTITEKNFSHYRELIVYYPQTKNPLLKWWRQRSAFNKGLAKIQAVDIIHGNVILSKGLQFIWAKNYFRKPLVVTEHASYFSNEKSQKWTFLQRFILQKVLKQTDVLTAVSPFLASEIANRFDVKKIEILPNVIDSEIFTFKLKSEIEKTHFLHVSTLDPTIKNPVGIIDSCKQLLQKGFTNFTLEIVSDESYSSYQSYVNQQGLSHLVHFSGPCTPNEIASKLHQASALILFSSYETFSCVIAESLATGTPVITTPVGIGKGISADLGIVVAINNTESLSAAMQSVIEKKIKFDYSKMRVFSEEFFPENVLKSIHKIYSKVLNQK